MARRRSLLLPADAKTEGERLLRERLRKQTYAQIARSLECTEGAVRHYARGRVPDPMMRAAMQEVLGWDEAVWFASPYEAETGAPATLVTKKKKKRRRRARAS